jgi:hypothetical protein
VLGRKNLVYACPKSTPSTKANNPAPNRLLAMWPLLPPRQVTPSEGLAERSGVVPNAFTSAFKELEPIPQFKATAKLGEFLEARLSESFYPVRGCVDRPALSRLPIPPPDGLTQAREKVVLMSVAAYGLLRSIHHIGVQPRVQPPGAIAGALRRPAERGRNDRRRWSSAWRSQLVAASVSCHLKNARSSSTKIPQAGSSARRR